MNNRGIFGAHVRTCVGSIGIIAAQTFVGGVFIDHTVRTACADAEEEAGTPQFLKIP